jgi:hypothetical protein
MESKVGVAALSHSVLAPEPPGTLRSDVDSRLAALARGQAPLRRVLARIAGRLVATRAWERLGFARLEDYARERVGLSARQLYDLAHVDAALSGLPRVEVAFVGGALPWSKARLLCRVAEAGDEARWVALARSLCVRGLEREVRAVDRGSLEAGALAPDLDEDGAPTSPRKTVQVHCTPYVQGKWWRARWFAQRVAGEKLPPWACMEAVVAEVLSALPLAHDALAEIRVTEEAGAAARAFHPEAANVCTTHARDEAPPAPAEVPLYLRPLVDGLGEADAFGLDARLRRVVALEQRTWAEAGWLLAVVASERRYLALGHRSLASYARERLGLSPRKARALLRLERAGALCPALRAAYRDGTLSWVQAQAVDAMFEHAFEAWSVYAPHVPREHRVFERDGWRCTAPGCSSLRNLHDHHVVFRSAGGSDALSNRTTLCAWHHLRGVHAGIIRCAGEAPDALTFELGLRAAGPPLARYRGEQRISGLA